MEKKVQPQKTPDQLIKQLIGKKQLKRALVIGLTIVRVSFDNETDPIFLASQKRLSDDKYIAFVKEMGFAAEHCRIVGWSKE